MEIISKENFVFYTKTLPNLLEKVSDIIYETKTKCNSDQQIQIESIFQLQDKMLKFKIITLLDEIEYFEYISDARKYINELRELIESM